MILAKFLCASPKCSGQPIQTSSSLTGSSNGALKYKLANILPLLSGVMSPLSRTRVKRLAIGPQFHLPFDKGEYVVEARLHLFVEQQAVPVLIDADLQEVEIVHAHTHFERGVLGDQIRVTGIELVGTDCAGGGKKQ